MMARTAIARSPGVRLLHGGAYLRRDVAGVVAARVALPVFASSTEARICGVAGPEKPTPKLAACSPPPRRRVFAAGAGREGVCGVLDRVRLLHGGAYLRHRIHSRHAFYGRVFASSTEARICGEGSKGTGIRFGEAPVFASSTEARICGRKTSRGFTL